MVIVPNSNYIGISKKISDRYERSRIKKIISNFKPKDMGVIARTICANKEEINIKNSPLLIIIPLDYIKEGDTLNDYQINDKVIVSVLDLRIKYKAGQIQVVAKIV